MSTFAKSSFNASVYSASRPTYPLRLFEYIFSFHAGQGANSNTNKPRWERAIDLGCGTGMILLCIVIVIVIVIIIINIILSSLCPILDILACTKLLDFAGQATEQLKPFQEVIGIDPSSVMLDKARAYLGHSPNASGTTETKFQFIQGSAEDLSKTELQPESVDLITAGTYEPQAFESKSYSKTFLTQID